MKKKLFSLILAGCMVAALIGCDDEPVEVPAEPAEEVVEEVVEEPVEEIEEEEIEEEEMEIQFDVEDAMAMVVKYYTIMDKAAGEYTIYDNENVDNGDTIDFVVRYIPSEEEEDEMIEDGTGPMANIYYATVTVDKATCDATDENGRSFTLYGEDGVSNMEDGFSFASVEEIGFMFSSGAGAWSTDLGISADGSFAGTYHDSDMGDTGEGYDNGTVYYCEFDGMFTEPEMIDEYSYEFEIESIDTHEPDEEEYIEDDIRYIHSEPYGLEDAEKFIMYLPGTPVENISEEVRTWLFLDEDATEIDSYVLCNVKQEYGFVGLE